MREILFYRTAGGQSPVEEFLDSLTATQAQKVVWVMRLVEDLDEVPRQYFKKLDGTDGLWEVRAQFRGDAFRLIGFFDGAAYLILCCGFAKKTEKMPRAVIETARMRRADYERRQG
jgi:phage-related protein